MNFEEYEQKCNEIRTRNEIYLEEFREDLLNVGLKENTINKHFWNVDFYINTYLLREEPREMVTGTRSSYLDGFLGFFFIRKCAWSTPRTIKSNAASIKKFYKSMFQRGHINESNYNELMEEIKDNIDIWIEDCKCYNDPNAPNPFDPFNSF